MKRQASRHELKRERTEFHTSREMDFFSEKELITQTGHAKPEWPLVFVKEMVDNALDACEEAGIAPVIEVTATDTSIAVSDNGPGLRESTLSAVKNFTIRASSREAFVAPDRGAQGNALMTILSMPGILDPGGGQLDVIAHGKRHVIVCDADPITQRPRIHDQVTDQHTIGTKIKLLWTQQKSQSGDTLWPFEENIGPLDMTFFKSMRTLLNGFAIFNPHLTLRMDWCGDLTTWNATDIEWHKWKPNMPTPAHWYEKRHFERLVAAFIAHDRDSNADRLISDFLREFAGLSGSKKRTAVLRDADMLRCRLSELIKGDRVDSDCTCRLLAAMQRHTRPVSPRRLGAIGKDHLEARFLALGVKPESFRYKCVYSKSKTRQQTRSSKARFQDELPWVLESAFGWLGEEMPSARQLFAGANWSMAIGNPFRSFGSTGEGLEASLSDIKAGAQEPIVLMLHLAHPRIEYTDRGKTALVIGGAI
jgi:hypothetical protein